MKKIPKVGDVVRCPADRGDAPFWATISHVGPGVCTHMNGPRFLWCTVKRNSGAQGGGVWPSHRLGYTLPDDAE